MGIESMRAEWRRQVDNMTFFGLPVQKMSADELLDVVGFLAKEREELLKRQREMRSQWITDIAAARGGRMA